MTPLRTALRALGGYVVGSVVALLLLGLLVPGPVTPLQTWVAFAVGLVAALIATGRPVSGR